jgi:hypothetical protein
VRVIVPLQRGRLRAAEMLALAKQTFGTDRFCAGIPGTWRLCRLTIARLCTIRISISLAGWS